MKWLSYLGQPQTMKPETSTLHSKRETWRRAGLCSSTLTNGKTTPSTCLRTSEHWIDIAVQADTILLSTDVQSLRAWLSVSTKIQSAAWNTLLRQPGYLINGIGLWVTCGQKWPLSVVLNRLRMAILATIRLSGTVFLKCVSISAPGTVCTTPSETYRLSSCYAGAINPPNKRTLNGQ